MKYIYKGTDGRKELKEFLAKAEKEKYNRPISKPIEKSIQETTQLTLSKDLEFITDENLYKEISKYLKTEFSNLDNKLEFKGKIMKQSNSYLTVAIDMYLKKNIPDYRLAIQADLETDLSKFKNFYVDSGLALRNLTGANKEKAEHIFKQLKQRGIKVEEFPIWLNLRGLELDKNLNFNLTDESVYSPQSSLNWKSGTKYSKINELGLPKEVDENSNRQIWTNNYALSRCYLGRSSDLFANSSNFSNSNDNGRMTYLLARK